MTKTILETERLRLREFERADVPDVHRMLADPEASRIFAGIVADPDYAARWVERNLKRYRDTGHGLWACEHRNTGEFLGDCGVTIQEVEARQLVEVGYHLTESARGHGYATESARACLRYAFDVLGAERVHSIVAVSNPASKAVASRIHARYETGFRHHGEEIFLFSTDRDLLKGT